MKEKNYNRLIIDLRGNLGWNASVNEVLYKYLTKKDLKTYDYEIKITQELKDITGRHKSEKT